MTTAASTRLTVPGRRGARSSATALGLQRRRAPRFRAGRMLVHAVVVGLMIVWFTPVLGLFVTSIRTQTDVATSGWWHAITSPLFTGFNYQQAIRVMDVGGSTATSLAISIPVTVMTTLLSAIGAFALTRMHFAGRTVLSLILVALLVIPPQVTLVPMLKFFGAVGLQGTVPSVWIYQVGFTIPFGVFLVRGFMASLPEELFESAAVDGATMLRTFTAIVMPLSLPVLASLAIMQFLWSWNDLLIPLIFLGGSDLSSPLTVMTAGMVQSNGQGETLMMAATFISILLPLIIVITMQRFFVRGVLGGAVKG
jgi:alpha-glucoside transport system permease protein